MDGEDEEGKGGRVCVADLGSICRLLILGEARDAVGAS